MSGFDENQEEAHLSEDESLLPPDLTPDCFSDNNISISPLH